MYPKGHLLIPRLLTSSSTIDLWVEGLDVPDHLRVLLDAATVKATVSIYVHSVSFNIGQPLTQR